MAKRNYRRINWKKIGFAKNIEEQVRNQILEQFNAVLIKTENLKSPDDNPILSY